MSFFFYKIIVEALISPFSDTTNLKAWFHSRNYATTFAGSKNIYKIGAFERNERSPKNQFIKKYRASTHIGGEYEKIGQFVAKLTKLLSLSLDGRFLKYFCFFNRYLFSSGKIKSPSNRCSTPFRLPLIRVF